mgnify:CR=1 FL=1
MVHFGNDWDTILDGEFAKTYYQNLRQFLLTEYRTQTVYPLSLIHISEPTRH